MKSHSSVLVVNPGMMGVVQAMLQPYMGKQVELSVKLWRKKRSGQQNAYYWGVVVSSVRALFAGHGELLDDEEVHEFLKSEVGKLRRAIPGPDGKYHYLLKSTTRLTTQEFEDYMSAVRTWASEHGCFIPLPNEEAMGMHNAHLS